MGLELAGARGSLITLYLPHLESQSRTLSQNGNLWNVRRELSMSLMMTHES